MRCKLTVLLIVLLFFDIPLFGQGVLKPFPQHVRKIFLQGIPIKPNHVSQTLISIMPSVIFIHLLWKKRFVKNVPGKPESYVWFEGADKKQCVSEGQGYGMGYRGKADGRL